MTEVFVNEILGNITAISEGLDENGLIVKTRDSVQNGIKKFQITPAEQAKLYANFEIQFSLGVITKLIDVVVQSGLIEQQIELEKNKIELLKQQVLSEIENTAKIEAEVALLESNKLFVEAQTRTEEKRKIDAMAGIQIKNWQAESTKQSAKFEEARRYVLINSTLFNNQIQKSKEENATLNSLAVDDSFVITESHLTRVKAALDGITLSAITYTEELTTAVEHIDAGV